MQNRAKKIRNIILLILLGCAIGILSDRSFFKEQDKTLANNWKLFKAIPPTLDLDCIEGTTEQFKLYNDAVYLLEQTAILNEKSAYSAVWIDIGVQKFLSHGININVEKRKSQLVCPPQDLYKRVNNIITRHQLFSRGRLVDYHYELTTKIKEPSPYLIDAIAESAFNDSAQESDVFSYQDIRPYGRSILALYGEKSKKYSQIAFEQISSDNSLGTSSAQLAIATGHPKALVKTAKLMERILSSYSENEVIPYEHSLHFIELAYALSYAGKEARPYIDIIKKFMSHKILKWSGHYGWSEVNPVMLCNILDNIEGKKALNEFQYCNKFN